MRQREIARVIKQARENFHIQRSKRYVEAQLARDGLNELTLQMGPNCNRRCFHCYGDYGPDKKGLPKPETVAKTLEEAVALGLEEVLLTDGEPLRYENHEVMQLIAHYSHQLPTRIITNGAFARTNKNAFRWFQYLKLNGFDLGQKRNHVDVSYGVMYKVHWHNYGRINWAIKNVFPDIDFGKHLAYRRVSVLHDKEQLKDLEVLTTLKAIFGKRRKLGTTTRNGRPALLFYPDQGSPFEITRIISRPAGRAKNLSFLDERYPLTDLTPFDLGFYPDISESLWVGHDGRVSFGTAGQCVTEGRIYGNVNQEPLKKIKQKILDDPIYQAFKLGGARFLYYIAQQINPDFYVHGRIRCDPCRAVFGDPSLVDQVRQRLDRDGIIGYYKAFVHQIDFRHRLKR